MQWTAAYLSNMPQGHAVIKLDFRNAFNSIRRDAMLEAAEKSVPDAYVFIHMAYATTSNLQYGPEIIFSEEGVQQGDPLGPTLFCLTIHPLLVNCAAEVKIGYLDDITLGEKLVCLPQNSKHFGRGLKRWDW